MVGWLQYLGESCISFVGINHHEPWENDLRVLPGFIRKRFLQLHMENFAGAMSNGNEFRWL